MKENEESTMNRFMRPYIRAGVALLGAAIALAPAVAVAQSTRISQIVEEPSPLLLHSGSPGYLGVLVGDVDNDSASKLKLKDVRGAVVTLIDHDAPAAQVGLRSTTWFSKSMGRAVESAEAFGRMMREIPPGRKITLLVSRDGATQTMTVELADRKKLDTDIWNKLNSGSDIGSPVEGLGIFGNGVAGDAPLPGGFHMPFVGSSTLKVGAMVEPLTSQMAEYLGVPAGLMVKQVARKSEAASGRHQGIRRDSQGRPREHSTSPTGIAPCAPTRESRLQVTILRDKKQQTLTLQVDSKKKGEIEFHEFLPDGPCPMMAFTDPDVMHDLMDHFPIDESAINSMRNQAEALQDQLQQSGKDPFGYLGISPEQSEAFRKQAEQFADAFKDKNFGVDQKQLDQWKHQMQQFQKQFQCKPQFDKKQMDELKKQMQDFGKNFDPQSFKIDPKEMQQWNQQLDQFRQHPPTIDEKMREQLKEQMDQLKRQLEEMQALGFDHLV